MSNYDPEPLRRLLDDGLYAPTIKEHTLRKIRAHNRAVAMFGAVTKNTWPQRAYIGLYSGAGRARIEKTGEIIETTPISALRISDPFTHYIFVDRNRQCTDALAERIGILQPSQQAAVIPSDVNDSVAEIKRALPSFDRTRGLISFCFVDPFDAGLRFETLKRLSELKMDFLIMLMMGVDARRNFQNYLNDPSNSRLDELLGNSEWRAEWRSARTGKRIRPVHFLLQMFDTAMTSLGYLHQSPESALPVKVETRNVLLYLMVYYTRHPLGAKVWNSVRKASTPEPDLFQ